MEAGKRKGRRKEENSITKKKKKKKNFRTWYGLMMDVVELVKTEVYGCTCTRDLRILCTKLSWIQNVYVEVRPMRKRLRVCDTNKIVSHNDGVFWRRSWNKCSHYVKCSTSKSSVHLPPNVRHVYLRAGVQHTVCIGTCLAFTSISAWLTGANWGNTKPTIFVL